MAPFLARCVTWPGDFARFWFASAYWNFRKSWHIARGRPGRPPCQHPSDSGRAGETACEAVIGWNDPRRFRRVCPLLQQCPGAGWRCGAAREAIRPFWGRALLAAGLASLGLYASVTVVAFAVLHRRDPTLRFADVALPTRWSGIKTARANAFVEQARAALAARRINQALLLLESGRNLDPRHYLAGLTLAQLNDLTRPGYARALYARLLKTHPHEAETTARTWLPSLLARGDFATLRALAASRLTDPACPQLAPWMEAWIFADLRLPVAEAESPDPTAVPAAFRPTLELVKNLRRATPTVARQLLLREAAAAGHDQARLLIVTRLLLRQGFSGEALDLLELRRPDFADRDFIELRLSALARAGHLAQARAEASELLARPVVPVVAELLSLQLIRHPDPLLARTLVMRIDQEGDPVIRQDPALQLALFCAAAAAHDHEALTRIKASLAAAAGVPLEGADQLAERIAQPASNGSVFLPLLQPDTVNLFYALHERGASTEAVPRVAAHALSGP